MHAYSAVAVTLGALLATAGVAAQQASPATTVSVGIDIAEGDYGSGEKTRTTSLPVSIRHERGDWVYKASLPYVWTEGTFSRESGAVLRGDGTVDDSGGVAGASKRRESGLGDLTLGIFYNVLESTGGLVVDVGAKAKLATADKTRTLITSGKNDYSIQTDVLQTIKAVSLFASLGATKKGDTASVDYRDPLYGSLGASLNLGNAGSIGVAWDFREKTTPGGDPVSELSAFYSVKTSPTRKVQVYGVSGLSDGSPDIGGGVVFSQRY